MNVDLQQDIETLSDNVKRFTLERIAPHVAAWDEAGEFPRELYREAAALGLLGLGYPEALGGTPAPFALRNALSTTMAHHSGSGGLMASLFSLNIGLPPVLRHGAPQLQQGHDRLRITYAAEHRVCSSGREGPIAEICTGPLYKRRLAGTNERPNLGP